MKTFHEPGQEGQEGGRPHTMQGSAPTQPQPQESHIGNMTIFRTAQFFVHAVTSSKQHNAAQNAAGNASLLEQIRWVSTERQRVTAAETRLLPNVAYINPLLHKEITIPAWLEAVVVSIVLGITLFVHAWNMFAFPQYQQDEGLLMSNAWAVIHGMIQPYAYTYNQTFFGWVQIAGWAQISGGMTTFGNALNSGRALMLLFAGGSSLLVYLITIRLSGSRSAGLLAIVLFTLSPLGISYQREVLLDNIGIFWLLLSLRLLVGGNSRLLPIVLAGASLGIAILTKEIFIIFFPVVLYAVWLHATSFQRKFAIVVFTYIVLSVVSIFALLAVLKGELLPTGALPWDHHQHPSLWTGIIDNLQIARQSSDFNATWTVWMQGEMPLFIASIVTVVINLAAGWRNSLQRLTALLLVTIWAFILLTNIIFTAYIVILLPLMALNIAVAINALIKWPSKRFGFDLARVLLIFGIIGALIPYRIQNTQPLTSQNAVSAQVGALNWIRGNLPANSTVILDSYLYADLHTAEGPGDKVYPHAQLYWNVVLDPDVRFNELHNDWQKIDYIVLDAQMQQDIRARADDMLLLDRALHHATLLQVFNTGDNDPGASIQIYQVNPITNN